MIDLWKNKPSSLFIIFILFSIASVSFAIDIDNCQELSSAGETYTLTADPAQNDSTCFTITAANITLDCNGYSITGNNSSATYGVYSNQLNTTVKNCNISNFQMGIQFNGVTTGLIDNVNISSAHSSSGHGIQILKSEYITISNTNSTAILGGDGIQLQNTNFSIINNSYGSSDINYALRVVTNSNNNQLINVSASTSGVNGVGVGFTGGVNNSLNCMGKTLTGSNSSTSYGVYSNQLNTTIKNCNISNFSTGIYINGDSADYANITNNTINTTFVKVDAYATANGEVIRLQGADYATIEDNTLYGRSGSSGFGVLIYSSAANNIIQNNSINATQNGVAVLTEGQSINNLIKNNNVYTTNNYGVSIGEGDGPTYVYGNTMNSYQRTLSLYRGPVYAINNTIHGRNTQAVFISGDYRHVIDSNDITGNDGVFLYGVRGATITNNNISTSSYGIHSGSDANSEAKNNIIANNTVASGNYAIYLSNTNHTNNTFINNTLNRTTSGVVINLLASTNNNYFYQNNITGSTWISNSGSNNHFNSSSIGNIYYFANGTPSWEVFNISVITPPDWATNGTSLPFNSSNTPTYWTGSGEDWHPWTTNGIIGTGGVILHNASVGHSFTGNFSAVYGVGKNFTMINLTNANGTAESIMNGSFDYVSWMYYNFTTLSEATTQINATFNASTDWVFLSTTNQYPDNNATIYNPYITPTLLSNVSVATCNPSISFNDPDGDVENLTARVFAWYNNGVVILGETTDTLNMTTAGANSGDVISCRLTTSAQNWTTSNPSSTSSGITVITGNLTTPTIYNLRNASAGHAFFINGSVEGYYINQAEATIDSGACAQLSNDTQGNLFRAEFVCYTTTPSAANFYITFANSFGSVVNTSTLSNTYPDHPPSLYPVPYITPFSNNANEILTCIAGIFSDPDGDAENVSNRTWYWVRNGFAVNVTTQTINASLFNYGDQINCVEYAANTLWPNSNVSQISDLASINNTNGIYLETVGFMALFILVMIFVSEHYHNPIMGVIAAFVLILLGLWLLNAPILIRTGDITNSTSTPALANVSYFDSTTNTTYINYTTPTVPISQSSYSVYTPIQTPFFVFNQVLGLLIALIGFLAGLRYVFQLMHS